jgi:N-acetyl-1-D-myo-inositol-2-amino-2-deoxy-alpha-D-glucopyranoside deacetylase
MLGYRDSGMIGTDANGHPDSFWQADLDEATRRLLAIVREARPSAIVSYDEQGNYGHPDHINAARIAREAYQASAGEPWRVSRFYELAFIRERWSELTAEMQERGIELPWDIGADEPSDAEADEFGRADADVTTRVDVSAFLDAKRRSMDCHKTQRQDMGWLLDLPSDLADAALTPETYVLRWRDGADVPASHRETWILPTAAAERR